MSSATEHSLYRREILRLATSLPHSDFLETPQGSATCRAPVCGSEVTVDVATNGNIINGIAIRAKACALGQASASVLRSKAIGQNVAQISKARDALKAVLQNGSGDLEWDELEPFRYASDFLARQGAIILPFDTLLAALEKAGN